ncbi:hypothetical protein D0869_13609 [Hortaea werneckii]|uniref:Ketoreductase (KR) domain-containing protein n=1 Tax=Hortaea werneckii TaxID=91943 RepID=A0A3M6W4E8_HORWE|nr:hypothetical protein D0869_13609 [Hortaea werneckii]
MAPTGLAILLGAGPVVGHGIARALASPEQGNLAIALISRRQEKLTDLVNLLKTQCPGAVAEGFVSDTNPDNLSNAFSQIASHPSFHNLPLRAAIFNPKCPSRVPYLEETFSHFNGHLTEYVGGAFAFSQLVVQRLLADHASQPATLAEGSPKKGTIIFTGVTGALKCNANFAASLTTATKVHRWESSLASTLQSPASPPSNERSKIIIKVKTNIQNKIKKPKQQPKSRTKHQNQNNKSNSKAQYPIIIPQSLFSTTTPMPTQSETPKQSAPNSTPHPPNSAHSTKS